MTATLALPEVIVRHLELRALAVRMSLPLPLIDPGAVAGLSKLQSLIFAGAILAQDHPVFFYLGLISLPAALIRYGYSLLFQ